MDLDDELNIATDTSDAKFRIGDDRSAFEIQNELGVQGLGHMMLAVPGVLLGSIFYFLGVFFISTIVNVALGQFPPAEVFFLILFIGLIVWCIIVMCVSVAIALMGAVIFRTMGNPFRGSTLAQITGAFGAYCLHIPFLLPIIGGGSPEPVLLVLASALASMLVFQSGGIWYFNKTQKSSRRRYEKSTSKRTPTREYRFNIMHLIVCTFWCGLVLSLSPLATQSLIREPQGYELALLILVGVALTYLFHELHRLVYGSLENTRFFRSRSSRKSYPDFSSSEDDEIKWR